jgi:para-nitrobenzyl esterase
MPDSGMLDAHAGSEDCLYLNVWSPSFPATEVPLGDDRLPVMFWIHGGANVSGQGDTYGGGVLAVTQAVIVVTVNYRLGALGWFRHASLRAGASSTDDQSGNFGTLDLIRALEWVRDNIAGFGGDPRKVTIFGESAGGGNVYSLLASPRAAGLFHRAIVQSGTPETFGIDQAENFTDHDSPGMEQSSGELLLQLLIRDGDASDRQAAKACLTKMTPAAVAGYLRSRTFVELDRGYQQLGVAAHDAASTLRPFPTVFRDGVVLPADGIMAAFSRRDGYNRVPVILGTTRDEFTVLLPMISGSILAQPTGSGFAFAITDKTRYGLVAEYLAKLLKAYAVDGPASAIRQHQPGSVFVYRFDWDDLPPASWLDGVSPGATHGLDVPFVFGHLDLGPEFFQLPLIKARSLQSFRALASVMMSYWAAFADRGDPGTGRRGELPQWIAWSDVENDGAGTMLFDAMPKGGVLSSPLVTKDSVLSDLVHDPRFVSSDERCRFLHDLLCIGGAYSLLNAEDYDRFVRSLAKWPQSAGGREMA